MSGMELKPEDRPDSVADWLDLLPVVKSAVDMPPKSKSWNWQTIWIGVSAIAAIVGFTVAFVVGLPTVLTWYQQHQNSTPKPTNLPTGGDRLPNTTK